MRAFVAMALPDEVRGAVVALKDELAGCGADVKWVGIEQLHITLKFLGEIIEEQADAVKQLLAEIGQASTPFRLQLDGLGAFPSPSAPRVVWVGVGEGRSQVVKVAQAIEDGASRLGLPRETRSFSAHVTLGRVRSSKHRTRLTERLCDGSWQPPDGWTARSLRLYQSVLSPAGPRYTVLADVPLRGLSVRGV